MELSHKKTEELSVKWKRKISIPKSMLNGTKKLNCNEMNVKEKK